MEREGDSRNRIVHIVKTINAICIASLFVVACSHVQIDSQKTAQATRDFQPERRSTEAEIRQHIVGEWKVGQGSDGCWYPTMIIGEDRNLIGVEKNGNREVIGTWEIYRTSLRVTPTPARFETARKSGDHLNAWDYFPIDYVDDHELIMAPGISMQGRWRYKR
jgi:hypothetical protein